MNILGRHVTKSCIFKVCFLNAAGTVHRYCMHEVMPNDLKCLGGGVTLGIYKIVNKSRNLVLLCHPERNGFICA